MKLKVRQLNKSEIENINGIALSISKTISSQAPRSVSTTIVENNLEKVQRLGSEFGIDNLPTSAQQLKHKVIKACVECSLVELTSKYNFKASLDKSSKVLCRKCSQNTPLERDRRSNSQKNLHKDVEYSRNATSGLVEASKSPENSLRVTKAWEAGKYDNKNWSFTQTLEWRILRHCIAKGIDIQDFKGFSKRGRHPAAFNKNLKKAVKERDQYRCVLCDNTDKRLDVHHVDFNKHNNTLYNLATLCISCHTKITFKGENCMENRRVDDIVRTAMKVVEELA